MKVRWIPGSLRLRITPSELENLAGGKEVVQEIGPIHGWRLSLRPLAATRITFDREHIVVDIGDADLVDLLNPVTEGVYFQSDHKPPVRFFIEKDFPCVHERPPETDEPESQTFAAPSGFKERHGSDKLTIS